MYQLRIRPWEFDDFTPAEMLDWCRANKPPTPKRKPTMQDVNRVMEATFGQ